MAKFKRNNLQLKTNQKIQLGNNQESVVQYDGTDLKLTNDGGQLSLDANGINLNSGVSINQFSNDSALGYGIDVVPTQFAVKTYVDTKVDLGMETGNLKLSTGDTTAEVVFIQQQGSSYYSIGYSIINTVDNPPLLFASGIFEKTFAGFKVMFSSPMDTDNYELSWIVSDMLFGSSSRSSSSSSSSLSSSSSSTSAALPSELTFLLHAADSDSAEGVLLEVPASQETFGDQGLSYIYKSAMQSDGRVVFPCYDVDGPVTVKCYEAGSLTTESWSTSITGSAYAYYSDITILNNGNIVVAWADYSTELMSFAILSPAGSILQGMTDGSSGNTMDYDEDGWVIPLEDGGFCLAWRDGFYYLSLWEANGTIRQARTVTENINSEPSAPGQMPFGDGTDYGSGMIGQWDGANDYSFWYNQNDLTEEWTYQDLGYGGYIIHTAVLPSWTDKLLIIAEWNGTIRGNIMQNDLDTLLIDGKVMLSTGYTLNSVLALPDDTFLVQAISGADYGLNYWIFDEDLDIVSGPTAAFTGITADNLENVKGAAI